MFARDKINKLLRVARPAGKGLKCSFCGRPENEVNKLIAGPPGVYICDECVAMCNGILVKDAQDDAGSTSPDDIGRC